MSRILKSVRHAELIKPPSWVSGKSRSRGLIAKGHRFEKLLSEHLASVFGTFRCNHGQWFRYIDQAGKEGFAQSDILITLPTGAKLIVEAKLTQCLTGDAQLLNLYYPLVKKIFPDQPVYLVQAFQNIIFQDRPELTDLTTITKFPEGFILDYHWIPPLNAKVKRSKTNGRPKSARTSSGKTRRNGTTAG